MTALRTGTVRAREEWRKRRNSERRPSHAIHALRAFEAQPQTAVPPKSALRTLERLGAKPQQRLSFTKVRTEGPPLEHLWGAAPNSGFHTPPNLTKAPLPSPFVPLSSRERALFWTPRSRPRRGGGSAPVTRRYCLKGMFPWRHGLYFSSDGAGGFAEWVSRAFFEGGFDRSVAILREDQIPPQKMCGWPAMRSRTERIGFLASKLRAVGYLPKRFSLVLSFLLWKKKEPRREGSKKTWRSASDGSSLFLFSSPLIPPPKRKEKKKGAPLTGPHPSPSHSKNKKLVVRCPHPTIHPSKIFPRHMRRHLMGVVQPELRHIRIHAPVRDHGDQLALALVPPVA